MGTFNARKDCPGRCGRRIIPAMVACGPCWHRLPHALRDAIAKADAERRRNPSSTAHIAVHRRAVTAALAWYRANTTKETTKP